MNKLGFAIKLASQGAGNAIGCNKGQWTSKVVDIREYLKLFNGLQGTDNIVTFMSFDESGCFLTQFRAISGRMGDFLSGWIYIPNTIEATGDDIITAYNYVRNILSQSNLTDLKENISSFFSKEYPTKEVSAQYSASKGQLYGVRFLGHYTLKEIVGEHRYQPYYSEYKAVFLLNKDDDVTITKEATNNFKDLTEEEIVKTSVLVPPTDAELQELGIGTKIQKLDGSDFDQPLLVNQGTKVLLLLTRDGFENMKLEVPVTSERQLIDFSSTKIVWRKKISASMFSIRDRKNEKIEKGVRIFVNGTDITFQEVSFSEEECRQAIVKVTAPDFETFEQRRSLLMDDKQIILNRKIRSFQAMVELTNGHHAEMTIESEYLPSKHDSPLKGYIYDEDDHGDKKILKMDSWLVWKQRLWGFFAALGTVVVIITFAAFDSWLDTHHFKFGLPPWEKNRPAQQYNIGSSTETEDSIHNQSDNQIESGQNGTADNSLDAAIKYLDSSSTWTKSDMEKYPDLKGLFEDMNTFNLSSLLNKWHKKLSNSQQFKKVYDSANKTSNSGWNPKQGSHNPTYNKPNDEQIILINYINWLDKDQTPKPSSNNGESHPDVGANSGNNAGKSGSTSSKSGSSPAKQGTGKSEKNGGL